MDIYFMMYFYCFALQEYFTSMYFVGVVGTATRMQGRIRSPERQSSEGQVEL